MRKMKSNSYEAQLSPEELAQVHEVLRRPGINLEKAVDLVPPWKAGKFAGNNVSKTTLAKIHQELRQDNIATTISDGVRELETTAEVLKKEGRFSEQSSEILDNICMKLAQKILKEKISEQDKKQNKAQEAAQEKPKDELKEALADVAMTKVLMKRQDQYLATARFKRDTCKVFMDWYEDERARRILESREEAGAKLEALGKLIYGEEW